MKHVFNLRSINHLFYLPALLLLVCIGCQKEGESTAQLQIVLTDDPGDYDEVNVDVRGIMVHKNADAPDGDPEWVEFEDSDVGIINLLDYTGGAELSLVDAEYPTGMISQIRLMLGEENSITIGDSAYALETPSAYQSGLKLRVNKRLLEGITYKFTLDFDAARSVIRTGSGEGYTTSHFILKPVLKVKTEATSGAVKGSVTPASENVAVFVLSGNDTVSTTYAPAAVQDFLAGSLPEGEYTVSLSPGDLSDYSGTIIENVNVTLGNITDTGPIELQLK